MDCRDHWDAWCAWRRARHCYKGEPNLYAFGAGFRAGYIHIMNGGDGCPPMLAPRKYWYGHCCTADDGCHSPSLSWFNGFAQGVVQGLYEGVAGRNQIVTSRDLYGQCEEEIDIHAMLEHCQTQGQFAEPHLHEHAEPHLHEHAEPHLYDSFEPTTSDDIEWTPQPLPAGAYEDLQDADEIWDDELFPEGATGEAPLLQPVEQLPTHTTEDAVSPALIEFLDQGA
jgi:hypothetical protein